MLNFLSFVNIIFPLNKASKLHYKHYILGREPWSSGYGKRLKGHGFESQHRILDGHFFTYICCKIVMMFV